MGKKTLRLDDHLAEAIVALMDKEDAIFILKSFLEDDREKTWIDINSVELELKKLEESND